MLIKRKIHSSYLKKNENTVYLFENAFITGNVKGAEITNVSLTDKGFDALEYYDE
jgi:hypothetical protein